MLAFELLDVPLELLSMTFDIAPDAGLISAACAPACSPAPFLLD
ncbi:MAG: hypothetical protein ABI837_19225 [Acidobacteriota bacterium]